MDAWKDFWKIAFFTIVAAYYLIAIIMFPLGVRDIFILFKRLGATGPERSDGPDGRDV